MSPSVRIHTEEYCVGVPGGNVHVKKWVPEKTTSQVPVVMLHDSLGSVDLWRDFPEILARTLCRPVIAYDRLGFGKSGPRQEPPSLSFIEEEASTYFPAVKSGLGISEYILFGHSVGGGMSIVIASGDKDCRGVVTVAAQAFVEELTKRGIEQAKKEFEHPGQFGRLEKWHGEKARWVLDAWTVTWLSPGFSNWNLGPWIVNVSAPVLAIHGERDEYGSRAFAEYIAGKAGGASELLVLPECGHMPHKERAGDVVHAVKEFIRNHCL
jgi:pimeloyl-ACP methyl ester carboxylesterase